ncbi:MAG: hypothetical protein OER12_06945 [Acidimicrobiia bacterium]|nr:hypothetical protein [Acidimicrobiia bacterium]
MTRLLAALVLVLGACSSVTVETASLSGDIPAQPNPPATSNAVATNAAADEICAERVWVGIPEPASFDDEAAALSVEPALLTQAVRTTCPENFYEPLSKAEVDWCGTGLGFGQNFFLVIEAGLDLGIESFTVVERGLLAKAKSRDVELSDYEIELFTAELQIMTESSRFERDWAEACRTTF